MPRWTFNGEICSEPGSEIHILYKPVVDEKGNIDLVESGKENLKEIIQSGKESCDISVILAQATNDPSVLNKAHGIFGDFTNMPETYAEMLQLQIDSKRYFDKLPIEVKKQFNNDPMQFLAQAGEKEWFGKLGFVEEKNVESEVKTDPNTPSEH